MPTLALLVGAIALLAAALRLGFLAQLLSKPVLVGYITGVGLTQLSSQLAKFTGAPVAGEQFFERVAAFGRVMGRTQPFTLCLSVACASSASSVAPRYTASSRWTGVSSRETTRTKPSTTFSEF